MIAALPMYDWSELRAQTDALWTALARSLKARGVDAPERLTRTMDTAALWRDPSLVLAQTCAMPWRLGLRREAQMVGTPDYAVEGCAPGYYCSVIVVRSDTPGRTVDDFAGSVPAFNGPDSQSGFAALQEITEGVSLKAWLQTGSHANSVRAVAEGRADIAAIDAVTWRMAERFLPEAQRLRVLARSAPSPGLPFITARGRDADTIAEACSDAIAALGDPTRTSLGLRSFVRLPAEAYGDNASG